MKNETSGSHLESLIYQGDSASPNPSVTTDSYGGYTGHGDWIRLIRSGHHRFLLTLFVRNDITHRNVISIAGICRQRDRVRYNHNGSTRFLSRSFFGMTNEFYIITIRNTLFTSNDGLSVPIYRHSFEITKYNGK